MIQFIRPITFLDIESTGVDKENDRIIELAVVKLLPTGERESKVVLLNPEIPIPPKATEIHHITDEMVKDKPTFRQIAKALYAFLEGSDLGGYNSNIFDIPLLFNEFNRAGIYFDYQDRNFIDVGNIFKIQETRTLSAAVKFYLNREHKDAHGALPDIEATIEVFFAQLRKYEEVPKTAEELHLFCNYGKPLLDLSGKFTSNEEGEIVFNFGKHRGEKAKDYPDFLRWMMGKDFNQDTMEIVRNLLFEV